VKNVDGERGGNDRNGDIKKNDGSDSRKEGDGSWNNRIILKINYY